MHPSVIIKTELDSDLLNVNCSPTHIKKSIMNLVANASEAIEGSGKITISTANRYLDEPFMGYEGMRIGEYAVLCVSDNGLGISSGDLERVFEPFYTKKVMERSGTGLGLTVVWNTVKEHEGYIDIKSCERGKAKKPMISKIDAWRVELNVPRYAYVTQWNLFVFLYSYYISYVRFKVTEAI